MKRRPSHILLGISLAAFLGVAGASEVKQMTFGAFDLKHGTCELSEIDHTNPKAKTYKGNISQSEKGNSPRNHLCNVTIPMAEFSKRYQYCALASIEITQPVGYVCEVFHFEDSVMFSYSHSGSPSELPMCSFVCPSK